jgi:glucose/mannose-6-phosphate isomerase
MPNMSSTEQLELDRETIGRFDPTDQLTDVLAIPEHLRDALWKVESAGLEPWDSPDGLVVAGMGGSAVGGQLARAILGDHASRPLLGARAYGLPPWTTPDSTVLCASYSGNTEETLACYEAAGVIGARRVVVTSGGKLAEQARADGVPVVPVAGGLQPRAAVGYMTVAALQVAALCGLGPGMNSELDVAADHLEELVIEWGPEGAPDGLAKRLARALHGSVPIIAGAGLTTPIAYRWKTQVNENAKSPAFDAVLPEADHNELEGWSGAAGRLAAIFLEDRDQHPRERKRFELTAKAIEPYAAAVIRLETEGETRTERLLHAVMLGDLVSLELAKERGVDPIPVEAIERFKAELGQP